MLEYRNDLMKYVLREKNDQISVGAYDTKIKSALCYTQETGFLQGDSVLGIKQFYKEYKEFWLHR